MSTSNNNNNNVVVGTPANTVGASTVANHAERPEKFSGLHFKRWQQKMFFYLTTMNLARFLTETAPQPAEGETDAQALSAVDAWKHSDFICRGYVLNGLSDALYNVYYNIKTSKELWESLEKKYKTEDAGTKKSVVARFLDFKMVDNKPVMNQVQELQIILNDIHAEGMVLSETFQVAAMVEKLPPAWLDFKNYLKHKRKEMSMEDLVLRLRIEEENRIALKNSLVQPSASANVVEHGQSSKGTKGKGKKDKGKGKAKASNLGPKKGVVKKKPQTFQGTCYNCDEPGHRANQCKKPKRERAHMVDEDGMPLVAMISDKTAMLDEVNAVTNTPKGWWIDTGATRHVCPDRSMFTTFKELAGDEKLYMGNAATADIKGEGTVILKWTSGKELTLSNVLYVPDLRKSLVSGWLLNKFGFRLVFESDQFVLTKRGTYVGKGYAQNGMFKLNVMGLGVKIIRTQEGLVLSQSHYVDKILEKFNSGDTSVARTPVDTSQHLKKNKGDGVAQLEYSRIIGSLMYLMTCTRPDLAYAVSRLSRYTSNPCADHWKAITRVLRYIRYTRDYGLHYTRQPAVIEGYTDANWISDNKDSKSTSGYVFTLGGAAIAWKSSKQTVIARSTMESEFIALNKSGEEAEWLRQFVEDIPRWPKPLPAICVHCDSQSAIGRAQSLMYNGRSRHMRRRHNTIRQLLSTGVITIDYVRSADNIADPFTKGLSRELVETSSRGMGLKPMVNGNMRET
ncbi:putative RNA-directed DNA polymerase [Helianthus annuus]|nr:putative RNA-directed DNA polymerase [Helianthus annuus]